MMHELRKACKVFIRYVYSPKGKARHTKPSLTQWIETVRQRDRLWIPGSVS